MVTFPYDEMWADDKYCANVLEGQEYRATHFDSPGSTNNFKRNSIEATKQTSKIIINFKNMQIQKYGHSCVFADDGQTKILFDPGQLVANS